MNGTNETALARHDSFKVVDITFLVLGIFAGTVGNIVTILSVTWYRQMKSSTNFLVANIGIADLLVCAYSMPSILAIRIAEANVFSDFFCKANAFVLFTAAGVSNFSFTLVAVTRNICVLHQPVYRRFFSHKKVLIYCAACWVLWSIIGIIFWITGGFGFIPEVFICFYYDDQAPFALSFVLTLLCVAVPTLLAAACYASLFLRLFQIRREAGNSMTDGPATSVSKEWKALAPVVTAFIVFNLCWGPYSVHVYIDKFLTPVDETAHKIITWLAVLNSSLNPIIYGLMNSNFRRSYIRILRSLLCCKSASVAPTATMTAGDMSVLPE